MTNRSLLVTSAMICVVPVTTSFAQDAPKRLPREDATLYRAADGKILKAETPEQWGRRREEVLAGMREVMGKLPGDDQRCPLETRVVEEVDQGTYWRRKIEYQSQPGCRTPAYLLVPKEKPAGGKFAAVLCLQGTNYEIGPGSVVGIGNKANRQTAKELAERGYVAIAPAYPKMGGYELDLAKLGWESGTLKAVWDNQRALDVLAEMKDVDATRVGAIGHSLGGHNSVYTAVFDERIVAVVSSCGLDQYVDYYGGDEKNWFPGKGWCQEVYMPKMANYRGRLAEIPFDFSEMISALAPRHVLISASQEDSNFKADSVDRIGKIASEVFKLHKAEDRLRIIHPAGGHDFPPEAREEAYKLFDAVLRK